MASVKISLGGTEMRIVRFSYEGKTQYGCVEGDAVRLLDGSPFDRPAPGPRVAALAEVKLLAPCEPSKVVAVGLNYRKHAEEMKSQLPANPLLFLKPSTAVVGPEADVVYPGHMSSQVDYEAELAVVISRQATRVPEERAGEYVLGYTCGNDVTARDLQRRDGQWTRSKGFDTFCPLGPWIVTDLAQPGNARLSARLNGKLRQDGNTNDLIFGVPALLAFVSGIMTLQPGDVIMTGTPSGVGPMSRGDVIEIEVEGLGVLRNRIV